MGVLMIVYCNYFSSFALFFYLLQHKTIDSVLERGERLDSLVEKSSDLSAASQVIHLMIILLNVSYLLSLDKFLMLHGQR